jgi:hypothetical protein
MSRSGGDSESPLFTNAAQVFIVSQDQATLIPSDETRNTYSASSVDIGRHQSVIIIMIPITIKLMNPSTSAVESTLSASQDYRPQLE